MFSFKGLLYYGCTEGAFASSLFLPPTNTDRAHAHSVLVVPNKGNMATVRT